MRVCIISSNRPHRVQPMTKALGSLKAVWYVGEGQEADYTYVGADVRSGGTQAQARNRAMEDTFPEDDCLLLSDDLTAAPDWWSHDTQLRHRITLERAIWLLNMRTKHVSTPLRGVSAHDNTLFMAHEEVSEHCFILGDLMLISPTLLRFDEVMPIYSDLDFSLKVMTEYGSVARYNPVLPNFQHRDNLGGSQDIRTPELEVEMIRYLQERWPGLVAQNPQRPSNAVLLPKS